MSVVFVILGFVLICLLLVHINLHKKKKELYDFIRTVNKTLAARHNKITVLINLLGEDDLVKEIRELNEKTIAQIKNNDIKPSQAIRAEILLEEKMSELIKSFENQPLPDKIKEALESYNKTQNRVEKNKKKYNKMITEFMEACSIKPASLFASFENIDTDFPTLSSPS